MNEQVPFTRCEVCYKTVTAGTKNGDMLVEVKRLMRGKLVTVGVAHLECVEDSHKAFYGRTRVERETLRNAQ